jgi:FkbM family methyltransferase
MSWRRRIDTLKRVGPSQVLLARMWIALRGDQRVHRHLRLESGDLVIDVGAYEGEFTEMVRADYGAEVISIEPMPDFAASLSERFKRDTAVTVVPAALGREEGTVLIHRARDGSSIWVSGDSSVQVPVVDVTVLVGDKHVALIKMNAEGAEFDVLDRLIETGQVRQVGTILVQFHKFVAGAAERRRVIRKQLRATHRCSLSVPWVWELWRRR